MPLFPMYVNLEDKKIVIFGSGDVAERKYRKLTEFAVHILVISKERPSFALPEENFIWDGYHEKYLEGAFLAIAATSDSRINHRIAEDCKRRGIFSDSATSKEDCTFTFPSVVRRGEIVIGISSSGNFPALTKDIRRSVEEILPDWYEEGQNELSWGRKRIKERVKQEERKEIQKKMIDRWKASRGRIEKAEIDKMIAETNK